jgi:hypothetical protein
MVRLLESVAFVKKPRSCQTGIGQIPCIPQIFTAIQKFNTFYLLFLFFCVTLAHN